MLVLDMLCIVARYASTFMQHFVSFPACQGETHTINKVKVVSDLVQDLVRKRVHNAVSRISFLIVAGAPCA